jgi:hypothetical protein
VTEPDKVKPPDVSAFPEPSPQPVELEQPVAAAEPALPRAARGRGEPQRPAAAPRAPRSVAAPPPGNEQVPDDLAFERDDAGYPAAPRLGGLRNLLVSLGRRSLINNGELADESDFDLEPRFERAKVRPAGTDAPLPAADAPGDGAPTRLTAHAELLPPKPPAEAKKENEAVRPTPPRRENRDGDEIQTLPSWRGQYRKKRYPPV